MSNPLRVAVVAEGPTDVIVIGAVLPVILGARAFVLTQLQPVGSVAFGTLGGGWGGVHHWCHQAAQRGGGRLRDDTQVFPAFDLLVMHLDADVAGFTYGSANIVPTPTDGALPCDLPCPSPSATTDALRAVLWTWCGEPAAPPAVVVCMPSKSTELWVVSSLCPADKFMKADPECFAKPEDRLAQQKKAVRIRKREADYRAKAAQLTTAWPGIANPGGLVEANRFAVEMATAAAAIPP